jgi:hypothetical protein
MRLDDLKKGEPPEVRVSRANSADAVLAHQDRGMRIVNEIAREPWKLSDELRGDRRVTFGGTRTPRPGVASSVETNAQAPAMLPGPRCRRTSRRS